MIRIAHQILLVHCPIRGIPVISFFFGDLTVGNEMIALRFSSSLPTIAGDNHTLRLTPSYKPSAPYTVDTCEGCETHRLYSCKCHSKIYVSCT